MADGTMIEWTDATWNPITGCSVVSPGCTNCYAMKLAGTRLKHHPSRTGLTRDTKAGPVWNGEVRFNEGALDQPLRWRRPRMIFVCAHGDLFAENVPDAWIDRVFAVMALAQQHTFQVLTKRAERMRDYLNAPELRVRVIAEMHRIMQGRKLVAFTAIAFPLPNVWLGVSAEDQHRADERVPLLLDTPAAVRWVSAEPLLAPIDFTWIAQPDEDRDGVIDALLGCDWIDGQGRGVRYRPSRPGHQDRIMTREVVRVGGAKLDWIVAGGESSIGARPMHPDWVRAIRDQCAGAGVAFHFKQWGAWKNGSDFCPDAMAIALDGRVIEPTREALDRADRMERVRGSTMMRRVGKRAAGRTLDGVTHDAFPGRA